MSHKKHKMSEYKVNETEEKMAHLKAQLEKIEDELEKATEVGENKKTSKMT